MFIDRGRRYAFLSRRATPPFLTCFHMEDDMARILELQRLEADSATYMAAAISTGSSTSDCCKKSAV